MGILSACRTFADLHLAKRDFDRMKAEHPLSYLFWECTLGCNLTCRHCGSRCSPGTSGGDLPGDEATRIFREIAEDFDATKITLAVTGGEPLTRTDLFDVMSVAAEAGFFWGMVTNAVLVDDDVIRRMERAGMGTVSVSIDGDAEAHAMLRGSTEAYERSMQGVALLVTQADFLECVQITTVVHSGNADLLEQMYDTFADLGVGEWRLLVIDPIGRMKDPENAELLLDADQLRRLLDFVAAKRKEGPLDITFEESGFLGLEYEGKVRGYYFHCPAGISIGSILHDGAIGACPSLERRMVEGDARTERFSTVWNERFERYRDRESTRRKGPCASCKWWNHCEGGSLHLWDWDAEKPRLCHWRMLNDLDG